MFKKNKKIKIKSVSLLFTCSTWIPNRPGLQQVFCSVLCNQVRRREVGNQLYELQEQTVVRREDTKPVTHQKDYEESYFGEKKLFDKDYIECESDQTVYIAELFAVDRTTLSEPIKLWERGSLKHRYRTCGTFTSLLWALDWTLSSSSSCVYVCVRERDTKTERGV